MKSMLNNVDFDDFLKLNAKQRNYIEIKANDGLTDKAISKKINTHQNTISRWKKDDKFQRGQQGYQMHYLYNHVPDAMRTMIDLLDARSELVKFQASKDLMDRTGFNPVERQEVEHSGGVTFNDDIE